MGKNPISKVAAESRREGLDKSNSLSIRGKIVELLELIRSATEEYKTARDISIISGLPLNTVRSRLTELVDAGIVEESPSRIKVEHCGISCTGYRLRLTEKK